MRSLRFILAITIAACLAAACGPTEPLKVGFISGQTGPFSDLGLSGLNGAILAVEARNEKGGINGRPVRLVIRDDEHSGARAKAVFNDLVKEGALAVVGPMTSAIATELAPEANARQVVLMGGTVVTNKLNGKNDFFFRAIGSTAYYAAYSARIHARELQAQRITVVFDAANRDYAENWAKDYAAEMERINAQKVDIIEIDSRAPQELPAYLQRITRHAPDLITFACSAKTAAGLMRSLRARNKEVRFATSAWAANRVLLENVGEAGDGALVEQYHDLDDRSDTYRQFAESFRKRFGTPPDYAAVVAYDATSIVLDALERHPHRDGLKAALLQTPTYNGLQTRITLDANGDAARPAFTTLIKGGRFVALN